jgi:L-aspartate oxidase
MTAVGNAFNDRRPVVVGAGIAGLSVALRLAAHEPVRLITPSPLGTGAATGWAQGGVAAAVGADDSAELHAIDTVAAGDGLTDPRAAARICGGAVEAVAWLDRLGAGFDRDAEGNLKLGLEAAHSRRRIVHAGGDATGAAILRALTEAVLASPRISVEALALRRILLDSQGAVAGLLTTDAAGEPVTVRTARVILATGGVGGLYRHTTNPLSAWGQGLAAAALAGANLADVEFVQFHPTALAVARDPMPLVSEAVRGEGALLIDETGGRFMAGYARGELEPRDVVSRAVWAAQSAGHETLLDARGIARFAQRFPQVAAACLASGVDPARDPIPIRAAAHYHMGGVAVDARGRASLPGLWACGEVAATGLHGANRLASNSLIEAAVCAEALADDVIDAAREAGSPRPVALLAQPDASLVRPIMDAVGVIRSAEGLAAADESLRALVAAKGAAADPALVGLLIVTAAERRRESRGAHSRSDFPERSASAERSTLNLAQLDLPQMVAA